MAAQLEFIPIDSITTNPLRPRQSITQRSLLSLADSIRRFGVLSPLLVQRRGPIYQIISGERRYRAAKVAGLREIPCLIIEPENVDLILYSLAENIQREPLNLIEQAVIIQRMHHNAGRSLTEIGQRIGVDQEYLEKLLKVFELTDAMRRAYAESKLGEVEMLRLLEIQDPIERQGIFDQLIKKKR